MGWLSVVCVCGHVVEEHEHDRGFFRECKIEGCGCADFEPIDEDEQYEEEDES